MLMCDDVTVSLTGKFNLQGVYTTDLAVPPGGAVAQQLVFYFGIDGDLSDRPTTTIAIRMEFPDGHIRSSEFPAMVPADAPILPGRTKWHFRAPFLVQQIPLRPGRIKAILTYREEQIEIFGPWIVDAPQT